MEGCYEIEVDREFLVEDSMKKFKEMEDLKKRMEPKEE